MMQSPRGDPGSGRSRSASRGMVILLAAGALGAVALLPVETRRGVNYRVTSRRVPLLVKAVEFTRRHEAYQRLAGEITEGLRRDEDRVAAVLGWTREHVRSTPRGWPIIDDHILQIIIRGYGDDDQMADVFATLATYAGVPAFWRIIRARSGRGKVVLSFALINGRWTVWDVGRDLVFRQANGALASVAALRADHALVELGAGEMVHGGQPYGAYVEDGVASFAVPEMLRAHLQMPGRRVLFETKRAWRRVRAALGARSERRSERASG